MNVRIGGLFLKIGMSSRRASVVWLCLTAFGRARDRTCWPLTAAVARAGRQDSQGV